MINKGTNGLELLSVLVTNNIIGEASRIGFGSTLAAIPTLIVYFTLQRQFVRGLTLGAAKG